MLIESDEKQHYCYVKRLSALLCDQAKNSNAKHCMMCLTGFTREDLHKEYSNGVNGRLTRIEMPEDGKNTIKFQNYHKQMKVPYVIYANFEALVRNVKNRNEKNRMTRGMWIFLCGHKVRQQSHG